MGTNALYVNVKRPSVAEIVLAPDRAQKLAPRYRSAEVRSKIVQKLYLLGRHADLLAVLHNGIIIKIHRDVCKFHTPAPGLVTGGG